MLRDNKGITRIAIIITIALLIVLIIACATLLIQQKSDDIETINQNRTISAKSAT